MNFFDIFPTIKKFIDNKKHVYPFIARKDLVLNYDPDGQKYDTLFFHTRNLCDGDILIIFANLKNDNQYLLKGIYEVLYGGDDSKNTNIKLQRIDIDNSALYGNQIFVTSVRFSNRPRCVTPKHVVRILEGMEASGTGDLHKVENKGLYGVYSWRELYDIFTYPINNELEKMLVEKKYVYMQLDTNTNKRYIGAAYGESSANEFLRLEEYIKGDCTGGNKGLKKLVEKRGVDYIKDNFEYSIIAEFDVNASSAEVLEREKIEKDRHHTKNSKYGYNEN